MEEKEFVPKHYSIFSDIVYFFKMFWEYEPIVIWCCLVEIVLGAVLPFLGIYLPKLAVDIAEQRHGDTKAIWYLGFFVLLLMTVYGIHAMVRFGKYHYYNAQRNNIMSRIYLKSLRIKYEYTESEKIKKVYWKAYDAATRGDLSASSMMVDGTVQLLVKTINFFLYSTVLGILNIWMLLVVISMSFLNYLIGMNQIKFEESLREEQAEVFQRWSCVKGAMGDRQGAKDIRIFGMSHWLFQLRDLSIEEIRRIYKKSHDRKSIYEKLEFLLSAGRDLGAYAFLLYQVAGGKLTAGEFVLYFGAITGFSSFVTGIMNALLSLRQAANSTDYLRAYMELPEEDRRTGNRQIAEISEPIEIEFRNVSFGYKGNDTDLGEDAGEGEGLTENSQKVIFKNLNLTIHAGEKLALVGINGAGKTTLVKLLSGMYEPDEGEILINGIDRRAFPRKDYYKLFSVVFQEQLVLPFTVGENIALQRADKVDAVRAWEAVEKAGLKETFETKQIGMDTYLTRQMMEDGIELSGGQQQRLLLARALYKNGPILILDEPTAALDPIAESEVYECYNKYSEGKTAIFISHRLASTRFSDRIVMLADGEIIEMGSHEELMKQGGAYANMYQVQSSYYNEERSGEDDR